MSGLKDGKVPSGEGLPLPERGRAVDGEPRVLIIDDDRDIGVAVARLLKPTPVVFAQSASGALGRIAAGGRFGAIICDIHMPGIDGIQFHAAVAAQAPSLARRILYMTGSVSTEHLAEFLRRTGCRCIRKPFEGAELRAAVMELLVAAN
jgi:CheY-like chemotaxis protein